MDLAVQSEAKIRRKSKKKYVDLARKLRKMNIKVKVILMIVGVLGKIPQKPGKEDR